VGLVDCLKRLCNQALKTEEKGMRKILVADDDDAICTLLHDLLSEEGFQVTLAHDGDEALDVLSREGGWVVFLDLVMPRLDGGAVLRQLQQRPALLHNNRVIVMSSNERLQIESRHWPRQVVAGVLPKPFALDDVLELARALCPEVL
jgi:CheY-like chemotaxis protein